MELGVGTDIVEISRIAALMRDREDLFLRRWFTEAEIAYCQAKAKPVQHLAARMAAKEAVVKSLRSAWPGPLPWRHIEVVVNDAGVPSVRLSGAAEEVARRQGAASLQISLSHGDDYATATAVCLFDGGG